MTGRPRRQAVMCESRLAADQRLPPEFADMLQTDPNVLASKLLWGEVKRLVESRRRAIALVLVVHNVPSQT